MLKEIYFESVRLGHPDKMCDFISDSILDAYFEKDKGARVACECFFAGKTLVIGGEITSIAEIDVVEVAKNCINRVGYNAEDFEIINKVSKQSCEIANLVDSSKDLGAGDQGVVVGYAENSYRNLPAEFIFIQDLMGIIDADFSSTKELKGMMPDGKGFITSTSDGYRIHISYEAKDDGNTQVRQAKLSEMVKDLFKVSELDQNVKLEITFVEYHLGGPLADTGLTGRKIIVDTYGGSAPHGGGAFSGKDGTKVDRTGAYLARQLAVSLVKKLNCDSATVWLGYAIGEPKPVSLRIKLEGYNGSYGSVTEVENSLYDKLQESEFTLSNLIKGYYSGEFFKGFAKSSAYGHFGHYNTWEKAIEF